MRVGAQGRSISTVHASAQCPLPTPLGVVCVEMAVAGADAMVGLDLCGDGTLDPDTTGSAAFADG